MRLATLRRGGRYSPAVLVGDEVLNLNHAADVLPLAYCIPDSIKKLLAAGDDALDIVRKVIDSAGGHLGSLREIGALQPYPSPSLAPPVPDVGTILCGSVNSHSHVLEMGTTAPQYPNSFIKSSSAMIASGDAIVLPRDNSHMVDWEGEFCVVIGRSCHNVSTDEALSCIVGYTLLNDISAREFVAPVFGSKTHMEAVLAWERNLLGKNFPTFCPIGPVIATKDELPDPQSYQMQLTVNGNVMQSSCGDDLIQPIVSMVSYYSRFYCFQPGDIISMGSPAGVGFSRTPQIFLKAGDVVEVSVEQIGRLTNTVKSFTPDGKL